MLLLKEPVYPVGVGLGADGDSLSVANDLGDSLGITRNLRYNRHLTRVDSSDAHPGHFVYPYGVAPWNASGSREMQKVFVSWWAAPVAVVDAYILRSPLHLFTSAANPIAMLFNAPRMRFYEPVVRVSDFRPFLRSARLHLHRFERRPP